MRIKVFVVCFLVFTFLICHLLPGSAIAQVPGFGKLGVEVGSLAPEFSFQDSKGDWVSLSDYRGKKVFIFSWSSWCRCKYQLPDLEKFYKEHKSDDFEIIAVASDSMGFKWAQLYLDIADATFVALVDPNNELGRKYNFWATENGFLIDEYGVIRMSRIAFFIYEPEHRNELVSLMNTDFNAEERKSQKTPIAESINAAEAFLASNPKDFKKRLDLAELHRQKGDLEKAESILREAVKRKRLSAEAHYRLGVILYQKGEIKEGIDQWERAYMLEPTSYIYMRNVEAFHRPEKFYSELMKGKQ